MRTHAGEEIGQRVRPTNTWAPTTSPPSIHTSGRNRRVAGIHEQHDAARRRHRQIHRAAACDRSRSSGSTRTTRTSPRLNVAGECRPASNRNVAVDRSRRATAGSEPSEFERGSARSACSTRSGYTAEFLASVRGRRKAVLFFSEGHRLPDSDSFGAQMRRRHPRDVRTRSPWRRAPT